MVSWFRDKKHLKILFVAGIVLISFYGTAAIGTLKIVLQSIVELKFHSTSMFVNILNVANVLSIVLVLFLPALMKRFGSISTFCAAFVVVGLLLVGIFFTFSNVFLYVVAGAVLGVGISTGTLIHTLTQGNIGDKYRSTFQGFMALGGSAIFVVLPFVAREFGHNRFTYACFALGVFPLIFFIKWFVRGDKQNYEPLNAPATDLKKPAKKLPLMQRGTEILATTHYLLRQPEVFLLTFLASMNTIFFRFLVFIGDGLDFTHLQVTEFQSIAGLGSMVLVLPLSWLSDRVGHFQMFVVYLILIIVAHFVVLLAPDTFGDVSIIYFCLAGLSVALYVVAVAYLAKAFKREELGHAYASRAIILGVLSIIFNYAFGYALTKTGIFGTSIGKIVLDVVGLVLIIRLHKRQSQSIK